MLNPSYLIKSRHDIYYFRYPLPATRCSKAGRVSISLGTRCPKKALRLANVLEYHSVCLIEELNCYHMEYRELVTIFKDHFAQILKVKQKSMDEFGPLSRAEVMKIENSIKIMDGMISNDVDCMKDLEGSKSYQEESDRHQSDL